MGERSGQAIDGEYFINNWSEEKQNKVLETVLSGELDQFDKDCKLFWFDFNAEEHVSQVRSHKEFIVKSFHRFRTHFPNLSEEAVLKHDDSKLSFVEVVGYTDRWVWNNVGSECWRKALSHHYKMNSHHPEYYETHDSEGFVVREDMKIPDLEESIVDMLACQWERVFEGREDVTAKDLASLDAKYLDRYTILDRKKVKEYLKRISQE